LIDYGATRSVHDDAAAYPSYGQTSYVTTPLVPSPMGDQASQVSDCVPYLAGGDYASSYGDASSPMLGGDGSTPMPEVVSYTPQRGGEETTVFVQIQSPYDLHSSTVPITLVFGSTMCECIPHLLVPHGSLSQYAIPAQAPPFISTGSHSFAVPLQVVINGQPSTTLQVGVYTYEQVSQSSPSDASQKKRRISSFEDDDVSQPIKRLAGPPISARDSQQDVYPYCESRSTSFSPYLQSIPAVNGFAAPYRPASSPRVNSFQYSNVSATPQSGLRAPSPLMPSWSPSLMSMSSDIRNPAFASSHSLRPPQGHSTSTGSNPTLIRTSTLHQSSGFGQTQSFNPYAMYPTKAVLKLNGDLDTMADNWTQEEHDAKRRLVQFTRAQSGSTIHADFAPVAPEKRAPNSICISCIYWEGKDECFVTSVDTIYLLESLVGVRFTVEEKNRIRRNLEGFRPLTVSKAKADSEEFFKVIMGFPAPKPRNIEKDVKVFPWKILGHALKKIIGKYVSSVVKHPFSTITDSDSSPQSASYSSTAAALPTSMVSSYGPGSDSGTDPQNAESPQSVSDTAPSYGPTMVTSAYSSPANIPMTPMTGNSDYRTVLPAVSQPFNSMPAPFSYPPAVCQQQNQYALPTPINRTSSWDYNGYVNNPAPVSAAPSNTCYNYMAPMSYPLTDAPNGA